MTVAGSDEVQRAVRGREVAFGRGLRMAGRCGPGFLVLEVSGLERLAGAQAQAAANSANRQLGVDVGLRKPPVKRKVVHGAGTGGRKGKPR